MEVKKSIAFLGDSFTWGEGLEFYSDNPKWISERTNNNHSWVVLKEKQDISSIHFRETHRYPYLVSNELKCNYFMDSENGGTLTRNFSVLDDILLKNKITDIIIQFSTYSREPLHMSFNCSCDFCLENYWPPILDNVNRFVHKNLGISDDGNFEIKKSERNVYDYVSSKIGISNITDIKFLEKADNFVKNNFLKQLDFRIKNYFENLENNHQIKIHFIDSWCISTSDLIENNSEINKRFIPLIGKDGKTYKKWENWLNTFEKKSILDDFPDTNNMHPTLEMHKYLSKSVVNHINKII